MSSSESIPREGFEQDGYESSAEKSTSNFWGIALMTSVFIVVILALAFLLL